MNIGLIYATKTGHSRSIALRLGEALGIQPLDIKNNPKLEEVDLLFIVGGIYGGKSSPELAAYLSNITSTQVKKAVLLTSSGGKTQKQSDVREILRANGVEVADEEFTCQGSILFVGIRHPNSTDLENAVAFVRQWTS
jgi:flavodoxin